MNITELNYNEKGSVPTFIKNSKVKNSHNKTPIISQTSLAIHLGQVMNLLVIVTFLLVSCSNQLYSQGYIDCSTIVNTGNDFIDIGVAPYKVKNGYTYVAFHQRVLPSDSYTVINGNQPIENNNDEIYIAIFDPNCNQVLGTFYSGTNDDFVNHLEIDENGNFVILGYTRSSDFPTTDGTVMQGTSSQFLLKFAPDGTLLFSTMYGGLGLNQNTEGLILDGTDIYTIGKTNSTNFVTTDGTTISGGYDLFATKYDGNGNLLFATLLGGSSNESAVDIATFNGGVILFGYSNSADFPTTDGSTLSGNGDATLTYIDAAGNTVFSKLIGGSASFEQFREMIFDGTHIYIAGRTTSTDYPTTDGTTNSGSFDLLLSKFDLLGNMVFSTLIGGTLSESFYNLEVKNGMAYLLGTTLSSDYPVVVGLSHSGGNDVIMTKFDSGGNIVFSTNYGSQGSDNPSAIALNAADEIFLLVGANASPLTTDGTTGAGTAYVKFNSDGSLCAATVTPAVGQSNFWDTKNEIEISGDTLTAGFTAFSGQASTDGSIADGQLDLTADLTVTRFVFCPDPTPIVSDILSPSTINVCQNGIVEQIIGEALVIDGSTFPSIYTDGVLGDQSDIALSYQWQSSTSPSGPWTDILGALATQKNYSPPPSTTNIYYRRLATTGECCGDAIVSTSNIVSVLVEGDIAPSAHAGGVYYSCPGDGITIGGSPAATGGTPGYTYNWENGMYTFAQPTVSPTQSTVYTLEVTDANGCVQADQATVNVYVAEAGADATFCAGSGLIIGGNALAGVTIVPAAGTPPPGEYSINYAWTPSSGLSCTDCPNPLANPAVVTNYNLTTTLYYPDGSSCQTSDVIQVTPVSPPSNSNFAGTDRVLYLGEEVTLGTAPEAAASYPINSLSQTTISTSSASIANLSDNDFTTGGHTLTGENENIIIDLGSTQTINQIQFAALDGQTLFDALYIDFSVDGSSWTEKINYSNGVPSTELTTHVFFPESIRYIRLRAGWVNRYVSISEFSATLSYQYSWTPGSYILANTSYANFDVGTLEMPNPNPITYTVNANVGVCNYYDQITVVVIEAKAGENTCGPTYLGTPDETPYIDETYNWVKITDPTITTGSGDFIGPSNIPQPLVSASTGGTVGYELSVTFMLNDSVRIVKDTILIGTTCGGGVCEIISEEGGCSDFDLSPTMKAIPYDDVSENWSYSWTSNLGQSGLNSYTTQEVSLTDNITRTYTVTMTNLLDPSVTCTATIEANSASYATPIVNATTLVTTCKGVSVNIGDPSSNPGYTYIWSNADHLDNGSISYPVATVDHTTNFFLTVIDNVTGCSTAEMIRVLVSETANSGPDVVVCDNGTVTIGGNIDEAGYTYSWEPIGASWQNGTNQNDMRPDVFVTSSTQFILTAVDTAGICISTDTMDVIVEPLPSSFTLPALNFCPDQIDGLVLGNTDGTISGTNLIPNGYSYLWSPNNLSDANAQNPTVNTPMLTTATTYEVQVIAPNGCSQKVTQTISPLINAPLVINDQVICLGESIAIGDIANPTAGISYSWSPTTDLDNAFSPNPIFTPSVSGTTTFTVTKSNGSCSTTSEVTITFDEIVTPTLVPQTICSGSSAQIGEAAKVGLSYEWSPSTGLDDAFISNPTFSGLTSTNFTLSIVNSYGCTWTGTTSVNINTPSPINTTIPDITICEVPSVTINPSISPAGTYSYIWTPNNYLSDPYTLNPIFYNPGEGTYNYTLEIIDQSTGCSYNETLNVTVNTFCEICDDGIDNDLDGLTDCEDDSDCNCCRAKAPTLSKK